MPGNPAHAAALRFEGIARGVYRLRGAVHGAPRDVAYAFSPPHSWYAYDGSRPLWVESSHGFYWDFGNPDGPYFVGRDEPAIVYRNPVPELFALESLDATLRWLDMVHGPSERTRTDYDGRPSATFRNNALWGDQSKIVCDVGTGMVMQVTFAGMRGLLELTCSSFRVASGTEEDPFTWREQSRPFDGPRVQELH